jgi:hypothetical protein
MTQPTSVGDEITPPEQLTAEIAGSLFIHISRNFGL